MVQTYSETDGRDRKPWEKGGWGLGVGGRGAKQTLTNGSYLSRPSLAAAPPGIILVMKMLGSSPMWGLSLPPAMLKPRPESPCNIYTSHPATFTPVTLQHLHTEKFALGLVLLLSHKYTVAYAIVNAEFSITHTHLFLMH